MQQVILAAPAIQLKTKTNAIEPPSSPRSDQPLRFLGVLGE
jgi:hypothetical protein